MSMDATGGSGPREQPESTGAGPSFESEGSVLEIPIESLVPDPFQPRKTFQQAAIRELAASIEQHGILQPLLVRPMQGPNSRGKYWIVVGERRYRAALILGLACLPCRVRSYEHTAAAVVALAENVHREDLSEIEKAEALLRLKAMTDKTWDQVAGLVRLSPDYVKRLVGLLKLEDAVRERVRSGEISARVAIALKPLPPRKQIEMAERVIREGLTAEQVRAEARESRPPRPVRSPSPEIGAAFTAHSDGGAAAGKEGSVLSTLRECTETLARIEQWIEGRDWAPSRVSEKQREGLDALYERVSRLQQYLLNVREPLRPGEQQQAERLRRADLLRF